MSKSKLMRDAFIEEIYKIALNDKDIIFISADFGAAALDDFRENLPDQFIHVGISEQNMVDLGVGLALTGKKVFLYAMAPFITTRCYFNNVCKFSLLITRVNSFRRIPAIKIFVKLKPRIFF